MTGRKADIIHRLYELQEKMEEVDGYWEDALERDALMESEGYEELHQALYQEYWDIMMKEVEERWRKYVRGDSLVMAILQKDICGRIGDDHGRSDGKLVDEYQGYILSSGMDPFGARDLLDQISGW